MIRKSYKFRIYPNKTQTEKLQWILDRCRELYNAALQERKEAYKYAGKTVSRNEQAHTLTDIRDNERPEYKEICRTILTDVLIRLDKAYQAFFRRVKSGERPGFPRFQGYDRFDSFTYADTKGMKIVHNADPKKKNGKLTLSKFGTVNIRLHRKIEGTIKTITIKREGTHWYAVFVCEVESVRCSPYTDEAVGIDLGVSKLATLSTGDVIENPRHYRKAEAKIAKAQRALARKKRGSNRRRKVVKRVARLHRKVRRQRQDFLHQWSRRLVDTYEVLAFEDIKPANLSKRPKPKQDENGTYLPNGASAKAGLNKSILDAGWHQFIMMCEYKAEYAGTRVVRVDPKYTSQMCSGCGTVVKKDLSERWHSCECGCELDRDHNAALNILRLGLQTV